MISRGLHTVVDRIVDLGASDHYCLFFNVTISHLDNNDTKCLIKRRFLSPSSAAMFSNHLHSQAFSDEPTSIHEKVNNFNHKLRSSLDIVAPERIKKKSQTKATPWKNEQTCLLKSCCCWAERAWRKNKLTVHRKILIKSISAYNNALWKAGIFF